MNKEDPYGHFAEVMRGAMSTHTRQAVSGMGAVLGTMTSSGVKLDDFKHEVQDYLVAELPGTLGLPEREAVGAISGIPDVAERRNDGHGKVSFTRRGSGRSGMVSGERLEGWGPCAGDAGKWR
ncbi:hypothetical protein ABIC22_000779 [Paenibacillus sp. PvP094]|uniref:hypothetical protein n=1 Tax=Paenibacillus sp. PvP094 TaxID=3156394 RepID=UPI00339A1E93